MCKYPGFFDKGESGPDERPVRATNGAEVEKGDGPGKNFVKIKYACILVSASFSAC